MYFYWIILGITIFTWVTTAVNANEFLRAASNSWTVASPMSEKRSSYTATLLPNGKVLVAGGTASHKTELYDLNTGTWSFTGEMSIERYNHSAVLLQNGKVLIVGGSDEYDKSLSSVDLYDPTTGVWSQTGTMNTPRTGHTLTLLPNGRALAAGGSNSGWTTNVASAEIYNPTTGTWANTGNMNAARKAHIAALLSNGKVLVAGGGDKISGNIRINTAELYNPNTGVWVNISPMTVGRYFPVAISLSNGKILVAGGSSGTNINTSSVELYDPNTNAWSSARAMSTARTWFAGTLLPNGKALVVGGCGNSCPTVIGTAELYDPNTNIWSSAASLNTARAEFSATLLSNGQVLAAGGVIGIGEADRLNSTELYTPETVSTNTVDFTITNVAIAPAIPTANSTFTANVTVKNQGNVAGDGKFLDVWNHQLTAQTCGAVGNKRVAVGTVAAGVTKVLTVTGIPAGVAGNKTFRAFVDSGCGTVESNESNNQFTKNYTVTPQSTNTVDFIVTAATFNPVTPVANGTFTANVTVKNQGNVAGDGKFLDVWNHQLTAQTCSAVGNKRVAVGTVAAGVTKVLTVTGIPAGIAGNKTFRAFVDSGCGTVESDESNNQFTKNYIVPNTVDFIVTAATFNPVTPVANGTFTANVTVKNQGNVAGDGKFLDVWNHQLTAQTCSAVGNKRVAVGTVAAGVTKVLTVTGIPAGIAGNKTFRAFVDSGCGTVESNESNNQFTKNYTVPQSNVDFTLTIDYTETGSGVIVTVTNQGTVAADGKSLDVWFDQPTTQTCGATGNQRFAVGILAAGASKTYPIDFPVDSPVGLKTFRAFVDSGCETTETNENNNQLTKSYMIDDGGGGVDGVDFKINKPELLRTSTTIIAKVTVENIGTEGGDGKLLSVWVNQPNTQSCGATGDAQQDVGWIEAGATKTLTFSGLPLGTVGSKTFRIFVDSDCSTEETDEANNQGDYNYLIN